MKKKLALLCGVFIVIIIGSVAITRLTGSGVQKSEDGELTVITSFYPMYVIAENIADGVENVTVRNLTENQTGCLHDYQLTTQDMRTLADADCFVMNGGGMESFVEEVAKSYPELNLVYASDGIDLLAEESGHDHEEEEDHDEEEHDHGDYNAHVWMDMDDYLVQIQNVTDGLIAIDPTHQEQYQQNCETYQSKVEALKETYESELAGAVNSEVIIFHDAFAYLAKELGMDVAYTIDMDNDTALSAGDVKDIIEEVNEHDIKILFTEEQYSDSIAVSISKETDAKVYIIDSLVTGDGTLDSYLNGMEKNLEVLKEALFAE